MRDVSEIDMVRVDKSKRFRKLPVILVTSASSYSKYGRRFTTVEKHPDPPGVELRRDKLFKFLELTLGL